MNVIAYMAIYLLAIGLPFIISFAVTRESITDFYKRTYPQPQGPKLAPFYFDPQKSSSNGKTIYHVRERAYNNCIVFSSYDMEETEKKLVDLLRISETYKYKE